MLSYLIPVLSVGRMAMGAGFLVPPKLLCDLFFMPITPATSIAWRLVSARAFAVGAFLFLSKDKDPKPALMLGLDLALAIKQSLTVTDYPTTLIQLAITQETESEWKYFGSL